MNLMLIAVAVISLFIDQVSVGILVGILVILNVVMGARQELKAKASVDALSKMQIPRARVFRDGSLVQIEASTLVPGDIVALEAGEIVPADGRILRSATLETQEAALTGESAPIPKDAAALSDPETTLGDRANMVFQNTQVTRGTATIVVTDTGMTHADGPHRVDAVGREARQVAAAARARLADRRARLDRVGRRGDHRHHGPPARPGDHLRRPARHLDGDLGDPDGHAVVRAGDALVRLAAARRAQRRREEPHRRRDARRHERDQLRQDRHAHDERDDRRVALPRGRVVHGRRQRLREGRARSAASRAPRTRTSRLSRSGSPSAATPP